MLKKISENYEKLSLVEDLDMIDIVKTILMTIPANNSNPLGPGSLSDIVKVIKALLKSSLGFLRVPNVFPK